MPLARSFTKRFARSEKHAVLTPPPSSQPAPGRTLTYHALLESPTKPQISLPTELVSTSNARCFEALELADAQLQHHLQPFVASDFAAYSSAGTSGYHTPSQHVDSDMSGYATPSAYPSATPSTPTESPELTDASSPEQNSPVSAKPTDYFRSGRSATAFEPAPQPAAQTFVPPSSLRHEISSPAIPQRAPSHSKREHERMAHRRSVRSSLQSTAPSLGNDSNSSRSSSGPGTPREANFPADVQKEWRTSTDIIGRSGSISEKTRNADRHVDRSTADRHNPFSNELEQLNEVAEEFTQLSRDMDTELLHRHGLAKFSLDDYLSEIGGVHSPFAPLAINKRTVQAWI